MQDQTGFLIDRTGSVAVKRLLRFETLAEDFAQLLKDLDLPAQELGSVHRRKERTEDLSAYFSAGEVVDKVRRLYRRDFDNFGYRDSP